MKRRLRVGAVVTVVSLLSLGSPVVSAGAVAITIKAAAQQYLALTKPYDRAIDSVNARWNESSKTISDLKVDYQVLVDPLQKFTRGLLHHRWPPSARADVTALAEAQGSVVGDLKALSTVTRSNFSLLEASWNRDNAALWTAVDRVRSDLRLPALSTAKPL